jgi:hypothetical protein
MLQILSSYLDSPTFTFLTQISNWKVIRYVFSSLLGWAMLLKSALQALYSVDSCSFLFLTCSCLGIVQSRCICSSVSQHCYLCYAKCHTLPFPMGTKLNLVFNMHYLAEQTPKSGDLAPFLLELSVWFLLLNLIGLGLSVIGQKSGSWTMFMKTDCMFRTPERSNGFLSWLNNVSQGIHPLLVFFPLQTSHSVHPVL